jgi:hypothetical protein
MVSEKEKRGESVSDEDIAKIAEKFGDPEIVAEDKFNQLLTELYRSPQFKKLTEEQKLENQQIRAEIGAIAFELAETSHVTTMGYLMYELSVMDRIEGMIDRNLKRLLLVRGVKSMSVSPAPQQISFGSVESQNSGRQL